MKFKTSEYGVLEQVNGKHTETATELLGPMGRIIWEPLKEHVAESTQEVIIGVLLGIKDFVFDSIGSITLVGSGILIILRVAGYDKGYKYTGVLFVINILVKYLMI